MVLTADAVGSSLVMALCCRRPSPNHLPALGRRLPCNNAVEYSLCEGQSKPATTRTNFPGAVAHLGVTMSLIPWWHHGNNPSSVLLQGSG